MTFRVKFKSKGSAWIVQVYAGLSWKTCKRLDILSTCSLYTTLWFATRERAEEWAIEKGLKKEGENL